MTDPLPTFRYHPDPVASGSLVESPTECRCCGQARGYIYIGPTYAEDELEDCLCPWCIADGSAAKQFDANFVDPSVFPDDLPAAVLEEVTTRTASYSAWQSEEWPTCCNDATAFLAPVGYEVIKRDFPEFEYPVTKYIVDEMGIYNNEALQTLRALNRGQGPTAYLFRCLNCGELYAFVDSL